MTPGQEAFEVQDFARDEGISAAEAERRLGWQEQLPPLNADATAALGADFGGVWVDEADGHRLKVGVVGGAGEHRENVVDRIAGDRGIGEAVDIVAVDHSFSELMEASDWLGQQIIDVPAASAVALSSGVRPDLNAVVLHLPPGGATTPEAEALVEEAQQRLGGVLRVEYDAGVAETAACTTIYCDPPLRAGVRISSSSTGGSCTSGFLARSRSNNVLYLLTAGHCGSPGTHWTSRFANNSAHTIGSMHNRRFDADGDAGIIRVDNPSGWQARAWVLVNNGPDTNRDETYNISADGGSSFGQRVCKSGSFGGTDCGSVTELNKTVTYRNGPTVRGLGEASYCTVGGDSGGPVYHMGTAYGLVSGYLPGASPCESYYQGIMGAENLMNVNVSHEG